MQDSHSALPQASLFSRPPVILEVGVVSSRLRVGGVAQARRGAGLSCQSARATALPCALRSGSSLSRLLVPAMVLESVVADLLNRFLGDYVENLNKSQLKLGIWGGKRDVTAYRHGRGGCPCVNLGTPGTPLGMPLLATQPHGQHAAQQSPLTPQNKTRKKMYLPQQRTSERGSCSLQCQLVSPCISGPQDQASWFPAQEGGMGRGDSVKKGVPCPQGLLAQGFQPLAAS